jgi:hypothetical protein
MKAVVALFAGIALLVPSPATAAPKSCNDALDASETVVELLQQFTRTVSEQITELDRASKGRTVKRDIRRVIANLGNGAGDISPRVRDGMSRYRAAAAECRSTR